MSELNRPLLDAAIDYLEELKAAGQKFVAVSPGSIEALERGCVRQAATSASKPAAAIATAKAAPAPRAVPPAAPPSSPGFSGAPPTPSAAPVAKLEPTPKPAAPSKPAASSAPLEQPSAGVFSAPILSPTEKTAAMAELRERALVCQKCAHLAASRQNVVFGVGDIHSPLMFVGEAPGAEEDQQGEPFVGKAGQLLTKIIQTMGLGRDTVYIANVLKCRPDTPAQTAGNRKPEPEEMRTCLPYLLSQIEIIRPKVIVALGGTAMEGLFGRQVYITKCRGQYQQFRGIPVMPTYHPSYVLRNQALSVKREIWEDMLKVMEHLQMTISEKQRGYFLKAG